MSELYKLDAPRYVGLINMGGDYCGHGLSSEYPDGYEDEYTGSRASDQEWIKSQDYDTLAATVIEQQAEIERLREALGILWSWCRNWDAEFIYDDEFDRSIIESLLGATQ